MAYKNKKKEALALSQWFHIGATSLIFLVGLGLVFLGNNHDVIIRGLFVILVDIFYAQTHVV